MCVITTIRFQIMLTVYHKYLVGNTNEGKPTGCDITIVNPWVLHGFTLTPSPETDLWTVWVQLQLYKVIWKRRSLCIKLRLKQCVCLQSGHKVAQNDTNEECDRLLVRYRQTWQRDGHRLIQTDRQMTDIQTDKDRHMTARQVLTLCQTRSGWRRAQFHLELWTDRPWTHHFQRPCWGGIWSLSNVQSQTASQSCCCESYIWFTNIISWHLISRCKNWHLHFQHIRQIQDLLDLMMDNLRFRIVTLSLNCKNNNRILFLSWKLSF